MKSSDDDAELEELTRIDGLAGRPSPHKLAEAIRRGCCPEDRAFDRFLPEELRAISGEYWTPLAVAARGAEWLDALGVRSVLDIGSGAGKFCVASALAGRCHVSGLEHRPRLVAAARALARVFSVEDRVRFIEGALGDTPLPEVDAYYLYNPFAENLFGLGDLTEPVELSSTRYASDIALVEDLLQRAPMGSFVLVYNGYGGRIPSSYREVRSDRHLPNVLRMWRKTHRGYGDGLSLAEKN